MCYDDRRTGQQKRSSSEVKRHRTGDYFRAQTRPSLFIGDRLQYEPDALAFLEEKKAETDTLVLYTHEAVWFPYAFTEHGSIMPERRLLPLR